MTKKTKQIKKENTLYFPNEHANYNILTDINSVWVTDITDIKTKLTKDSQSKICLCIVLDISTNFIIGAKCFKKSNKRGSVSAKAVCNFIELLVELNDIKNPLILHTDRGVEYANKYLKGYIDSHPYLIGSMSHKATPIDNSVMERFNRTFKNQTYSVFQFPEEIDTIFQMTRWVDKKVEWLNHKFKSTKNYNNTSAELRTKLQITQTEQPFIRRAKNNRIAKDANAHAIQRFRQQVAKEELPVDTKSEKLALIEAYSKRLVKGQMVLSHQIDTGFEELGPKIQEILDHVKPKPKKKVKRLPLRDPATNTVYNQVMRHPKPPKVQRIAWFRFRVTTTLLYFTGLRINEVGSVDQQTYYNAINNGTFQIEDRKVNKYKTVVITKKAQEKLKELENEAREVFNHFPKLNNCKYPNKFIHFINTKTKLCTLELGLNISSHSYRANKITTLLELAPLQKVKEWMSHADIRSTLAYNRYHPDKKEMIDVMERAESGENEIIDISIQNN